MIVVSGRMNITVHSIHRSGKKQETYLGMGHLLSEGGQGKISKYSVLFSRPFFLEPKNVIQLLVAYDVVLSIVLSMF